MFEKEQLFVLLFANGVLLSFFFFFFFHVIRTRSRYLKSRVNARPKIAATETTSVSASKCETTKVKFFKPLARERDLPLYRHNFSNTLLNTRHRLRPNWPSFSSKQNSSRHERAKETERGKKKEYGEAACMLSNEYVDVSRQNRHSNYYA